MARSLRIMYAGAWYHVMNRGAARQFVYQTDDQRNLFLSLLEEVHLRYQAEIHAYCLMGNHYHLLIRTQNPNLDRVMRHIDGIYTQRYNKSMGKDGSLFRGRYKSCLIQAENYLLQTSRYIHLNPVVAKIVSKPEDYKWSSYRFYLNLEPSPTWLNRFNTLQFFDQKNPHEFYKDYIQENCSKSEFFKKIRGSAVLGNEAFIKEVTQLIPKKHCIDEIPMHKKLFLRPSLSLIQEEVADFFNITIEELSVAKPKITYLPRIIALYLSVKLTQKTYNEISSTMGNVSASAISQAYYKIQKKTASDKNLASIVANLEQKICLKIQT
jgi:putative transposase